MGRPRDDFDLLLAAPHPVEAELARGILADAGIPVLVHGGDFDVAELGTATHAMLRRPDVYVPRGSRERALQALRDSGYDERTELDEGRSAHTAQRGPKRSWVLAFFFLWCVAPLIGLIYLIFVSVR